MHTSDEKLKAALALHWEGKLTEAEVLYRQLLEVAPSHPQALSMLGMILMDGSGKAEAEELFLSHLKVDPENALTRFNLARLLQGKNSVLKDRDAIALFRQTGANPDLAPIFNILAGDLHRLGYWDAALVTLDQALSIDPAFGAAHDNRGVVLYDCRRFSEAAGAHRAALAHTPTDAGPERIFILLHFAKAAYEAENYTEAERACRTILEMDADNAGAIDHLAKVLYRLRRDGEAVFLLNRLARVQGVVIREQPEHAEARILLLGAVGAGHVPTRYLFDPALFTTMILTFVSPDQPDAPMGVVSDESLLEADLLFNTLGEVEKDGGQSESVTILARRLSKPLLNPPERVARSGRDRVHELYGDIPGLVVPRVCWRQRDELAGLGAVERPFLIRPGGVHGGEDFALIQAMAELAEYLAKVPDERFLLTDFHDFKGSRDCYRKYRFIFVDRQPYPCHLAIAENWLVHYWRARMGREEWKKREEEEFLSDWRGVFGPAASAVVEQVAQRLDLDYGGMDCSLLANGDVLFFEANACMLVHLDDAEAEFSYKHRAVPRIRAAMTQMIRQRIAVTQKPHDKL